MNCSASVDTVEHGVFRDAAYEAPDALRRDLTTSSGMVPACDETCSPCPINANAPSEDELLDRAKTDVEAGENSLNSKLRDAAEALAQTQELHGTSKQKWPGSSANPSPGSANS